MVDQPRSGNLFPILKNATILQIMEEVDIPLSEAELTDPGRCKERVREVFSQLLVLSWGLTPGSLASLPPRVLSRQAALAHPSLYDDALPEAKFFSLLSALLRVSGYHEFGFRDLAAPQYKRFRRQLSAVINFLKYREDNYRLLDQAMEEREELFAALDEVTQNHMTLEGNLEEAKANHHKKMLEREEAEAECKEMEADLAQQNKIQSSIRQETYQLKKSVNELKDRTANLSIALRELHAEERQLSKEVVESPDRVRLDLAAAHEKLEEVKAAVAEKRSARAAEKKRTEHTVAAGEGVREAVAAMEAMEVRAREHEAATRDEEEARRRLEAAERDLKEKEEVREGRERQLEAAEKQKADTVAALTLALRSAQDEVDAAVDRLGAVESARSDGMARIEALERRAEEFKAEMERERKDAEMEIADRIAVFREWEERYWEKEAALDALLGLD